MGLLGLLVAALPALTASAAAGAGAPAAPAATALALAPTPVAPAGSLTPGQSVVVSLTATDSGSAPVPDAVVYLSFTSTAAAPGSASVAGTALTATPAPFTTTQNGVIAIEYAAAAPQCSPNGTCIPAGFPTAGSDQIMASNGPGGPVTITDSYSYAASAPAAADRYTFSPDPVAAPAELVGGQAVPVALSVATSAGAPESSAAVYVSLSGATSATGGGTSASTSPTGTLAPSATGPGSCSSSVISTTPVECFTDPSGQLGLAYTAAGTSGSAPPASGVDVITAANRSSSPSETATDRYDYSAPSYSWSNPIAPTGSLGANQSQSVAFTMTDSSGAPVANAPVYLWLGAPPGQTVTGSASATGAVPSNANPTGSPLLGTAPAPFQTDAFGRVVITYSTPAAPPAQGVDGLVAQNRISAPIVQLFDAYDYGPAEFTFTPDPVAPGASLQAGATVSVQLTVAASAPAVYLSFRAAPGGGRASVNGQALTGVPVAFPSPGGRLQVTYTAPSSPPSAGADRIVAQDAASAPAQVASDLYSFSAAAGPTSPPGAKAPPGAGYWEVAGDGGIFTFGAAGFFGSEGAVHLARPIVGMAATPDGAGYWLVAGDGGIFTFGDAGFFGSEGGAHLAAPIVGMAATPDGRGYWLVAGDGGVFNFGDAHFYGSGGGRRRAGPIVGMAATPDGGGYWLAGRDGSVLAFGDAPDRGSEAGAALAAPVVGIAPTATGLGYWLVAGDGGVFSFGDAAWFGSTGGQHLNQSVLGLEPTPNGAGYWLVAGDGGVFSFGNAPFAGSEGGHRLNSPIVGLSTT